MTRNIENTVSQAKKTPHPTTVPSTQSSEELLYPRLSTTNQASASESPNKTQKRGNTEVQKEARSKKKGKEETKNRTESRKQ